MGLILAQSNLSHCYIQVILVLINKVGNYGLNQCSICYYRNLYISREMYKYTGIKDNHFRKHGCTVMVKSL